MEKNSEHLAEPAFDFSIPSSESYISHSLSLYLSISLLVLVQRDGEDSY